MLLEERVKLRTEELRKSEQMYKTIVENSNDLITLSLPDGTISYLSPACFSVLGHISKNLLNTNLTSIIHHEDLQKFEDIFENSLTLSRNNSIEYRIISEDGKTKWISHSWSIIIDEKMPKLIVSIIRDITNQKELQKQKDEMQKQIFQTSKLASIGELAAGVAHEINNPLTILNGYTEIIEDYLKEHRIYEPLEKTFSMINNSSERISEIVNGLKTFARADSNSLEEIDIMQVIESSVTLVHNIYEKKGIKIEINSNAADSTVSGSRGKFQQVLMNMFSNSKDAMKTQKEPKIVVTTSNPDSKTIIVEISDNGCGIPESILDKIFDPFFTTKDIGVGTGLGLGISHDIIDQMGGYIKVSSAVNIGTSFYIYLPLSAKSN
jgi:two-component system, NtrC family, sensor kinase